MTLSRSACALAALLKEGGEAAKPIRLKIHRAQLWGYATGRRAPSIETATLLHTLTDGRVAVDGWTESAAQPSAA